MHAAIDRHAQVFPLLLTGDEGAGLLASGLGQLDQAFVANADISRRVVK